MFWGIFSVEQHLNTHYLFIFIRLVVYCYCAILQFKVTFHMTKGCKARMQVVSFDQKYYYFMQTCLISSNKNMEENSCDSINSLVTWALRFIVEGDLIPKYMCIVMFYLMN